MKKIGLLIVLMISLVSCSNDDSKEIEAKISTNDYYGKWTNVIEAKDINSPYVWREYYIFNADKTFIKSRTDKGVTTTGTGTFEFLTLDNRTSIVLTYSSPTNMAYSCTSGVGGTAELLYIHKGFLENAAGMCDYFASYEKAK